MTTTAVHVPDDTDTLKAALIEARAKLSGAEALIEHLQWLIAKMKREQPTGHKLQQRSPAALIGCLPNSHK